MVDAGIMRNLASPDKLLEWARLEGVREGAIQVIPVWQIPCVLVVNTGGSVDETAMNTVVSRRWCVTVSITCCVEYGIPPFPRSTPFTGQEGLDRKNYGSVEILNTPSRDSFCKACCDQCLLCCVAKSRSITERGGL